MNQFLLISYLMNPTIDNQFKLRFMDLWRLIGNSPMLAINFRYKGEKRIIYAKAEHYNVTGSIKDRMALYILERAYAENRIKPGDTIVEATSGNTGIAFAAIGKALGHDVRIIMPDWMSKERVDIIKSLGAQIIPVSKDQGGFIGSIRISEEIAAREANIFLPQQFPMMPMRRRMKRQPGLKYGISFVTMALHQMHL